MGLKTSQNINFRPFLVFFQRFCRDRVFSVATENFVVCDIKLCHDRVFSVATEFSLLQQFSLSNLSGP